MELQTQLRFDIFGQSVLPDMLDSSLLEAPPMPLYSELLEDTEWLEASELLEGSEVNSELLVEQTRQLFHHTGSDDELLSQILDVINAIANLCDEADNCQA